MAEKSQQTKKNHARFDPTFHFFLVPVLIMMLLWTIVRVVRHAQSTSVILLILVVLMIVIATMARVYALKVQDRVIRLEERLRLATLLPEPLRLRVPELTERQLIALRFASDTEIPMLVERVLRDNLDNKQIKNAIQTWRADYWRV